MLRPLIVALIIIPSIGWAKDDYARVKAESEQAFNLKANQCYVALGSPAAGDRKKSDEVFACANTVMQFNVRDRDGKPALHAYASQVDTNGIDTQVLMSLNCRPDWHSVSFTMDVSPSVASKLEGEVFVAYKIGKNAPKTQRWRLIDGQSVAISEAGAKEFINAIREEAATEILVKFSTPDRTIETSFALENVLKFRELYLNYCS